MRFLGALMILLCLCAPCLSATEELAPGFDQCMKNAESFEEEAVCYKRAASYQAERLDKFYKQARSLCGKIENQGEIKKCREELKNLELAWLDFQNRTYVYLLNEGIFGPYNYKDKAVREAYADAIPRAKKYAASFEAHETKRQADRLELFYKLWERWQ